MKRLADADLSTRAKAARDSVRSGRLDGAIALSYVIWPEAAPRDGLDAFRIIVDTHDPNRCHAAKRSKIFLTRCEYRAVEDGLCGQHLRCRREGKPLTLYQEYE